MRAQQLSRWQKAGALVPMAVLVGAWGVALANTGLASAADGDDDTPVPSVPAMAIEQPASVQETPAGIDPRAGAEGTLATLSTNGIPISALSAYRRAESLLARADESCRLPWHVVAAIGRVESNHGRINGSALDAQGLATPGIYGIPLDGENGTARITDTDGGELDGDTSFDRAVGPMQFIPGTWSTVGVDADNDGSKNPQDVDDAATSAGIYLCAGEGDLSDESQLRSAILRYNRSSSYADTVLAISKAYAQGDFTQSPDSLRASSPLVNRSFDRSLSPAERRAAQQAEQQAAAEAAGQQQSGSPATGGSGGSGGTSSTPTPGQPTPGTPTTTGGGLTDLVGGLVGTTSPSSPTEPAPAPNPVGNTLTWAEAKLICVSSGISALDLARLTACITSLLG